MTNTLYKMASTGENEVLWETVDYGEAAFHVISYRRENGRVETERPAQRELRSQKPRPVLTWPLLRCWVASRCS